MVQFPPNYKEVASKLQRFSKDLSKELLPAHQALDHHCAFIESKSKFYKDSENIKKKRSNLANTTSKVKAGLAKMWSSKAKLGEQLKELEEKKSKLLKYEQKIDAAINALKEELKKKLSEGQMINEELPTAEITAKKAKETH